MSLYRLGLLSFRTAPLNVDRVERRSATDHVPKPVIGRAEPLEYVGEGASFLRLSGKLFPKVIGGMRELAWLHGMRMSGMPQFLMRGDGVPLGWFVIQSLTEYSGYLAADGVGQQIELTIELRRDNPPRASALFEIMGGVLA